MILRGGYMFKKGIALDKPSAAPTIHYHPSLLRGTTEYLVTGFTE
jgi:hypothetical protein